MPTGKPIKIDDPAYYDKIRRIIKLRASGRSLREIGRDQEVQLSADTCRVILDKVGDYEWKKRMEMRDRMRRDFLINTDHQIAELSDAWERSKLQTKEIEEEKLEMGEGEIPDGEYGKGPGVKKYKRRTKMKGKPARDGGVAFQEAITKLRRLQAEVLGLIERERPAEEMGDSILYVPVDPGTPGAKPFRPFEFPAPKQVYEITAADEAIPPELLPDAPPRADDQAGDGGIVAGQMKENVSGQGQES